jgi:tetratricopeptide (TPR) repeat protein
MVGERPARSEPADPKRRARRAPSPGGAPPRRRRRRGPADVEDEVRRLAGRDGDRAYRRLMDAADAYAHDRERDALRILRPLRDQLPASPSVRELVGLCQYRLGNYHAAAKELEAYSQLADSVEQNPVLMDCYRAQRKWRKVEDAWSELAAVSPSAEAVAEGRIVYAGALADQGRVDEALALLRKRADPERKPVRSPKEHHLRLWYALADLEERAGNLARARDLFDRVRRADPNYVDVAERRAAL